jgi:ADP-ribose pyrophosphatase YjhB (NUDIX family)
MPFVFRLLAALRSLYYRIFRPMLVGVRLILLDGVRILLVKHTYESVWNLPGGTVKKGETLEVAVRREAAEELGAELGELHLFGVYTSFYEGKSDHIAVFLCKDGVVYGRKNYEIEAYGFFALDELPEITPGARRRIDELQESRQNPAFGIW